MPAQQETVDATVLDVAALAYAGRVTLAGERERTVLREALTCLCLPFAGRLAGTYRGRGESFEDAERIARLGLAKAIDRYAPGRGSFTAYAVIAISGELKRHVWNGSDGVVADLLMLLPAQERRLLALRCYGNRSRAEIAAELGLTPMQVSGLLGPALTWLRLAMLSDTPPTWVAGTDQLMVSTERADGRTVVTVRGEVDQDNAARLRRGLRDAIGGGGGGGPDRLVIDLTGVPLMDAAGVAALVEAASAAGVELSITGAQQYVSRILAVSGLAGLVH